MALRHQLWLVLPLSITDGDTPGKPVNSGMYGVGGDVCFGSIAAVQTDSNSMTALGRIAVIDQRVRESKKPVPEMGPARFMVAGA